MELLHMSVLWLTPRLLHVVINYCWVGWLPPSDCFRVPPPIITLLKVMAFFPFIPFLFSSLDKYFHCTPTVDWANEQRKGTICLLLLIFEHTDGEIKPYEFRCPFDKKMDILIIFQFLVIPLNCYIYVCICVYFSTLENMQTPWFNHQHRHLLKSELVSHFP